jgi:peptidoglycan pentaglycine glycine transferase (the second and third glycine)
MELIKIDESEFQSFALSAVNKNFFQTKEIAAMRKENGWEIEYLALKQRDIIAVTMLVSIKRFLNKKEYYSPRGLLFNEINNDVFETFIIKLNEYVKKNNGMFLRIDPYIEKHDLDINGNIIKDSFNNYPIINSLIKNGYKQVLKEEQISYMFALDLNISEEQILYNMSSKTKKSITDAYKYGVKIKELKYDELDIFINILDETSERRNFSNRGINYYQKMYKLFNDKAKFLVSYIDINETKDILNKELEKEQLKLNSIDNKQSNLGKIKEQTNIINGIENKLNDLKQINESIIYLSTSMFILYGDEVVYLSSGNNADYLKYGGQYIIQWEMIKYAIDNKYKRYNFYGINRNLDPSHNEYGIYFLKKDSMVKL